MEKTGIIFRWKSSQVTIERLLYLYHFNLNSVRPLVRPSKLPFNNRMYHLLSEELFTSLLSVAEDSDLGMVKFALFVKQLTLILGEGLNAATLPNKVYSAIIGIALFGLGIIMT